LYDAKGQELVQEDTSEKKKDASRASAWALPFFAMVVMFSCAALVTTRARRAARSTREFRRVTPVQESAESDGQPFLTDDDLVLE